MANKNKHLHKASKAKKDEFYTQLSDIEKELRHYKRHFKGKVVLCNCDDPRVSNFFHYFAYNFEKLGLKKLITTCYKNQNMDLFSQNESYCQKWCLSKLNQAAIRISGITSIPSENCTPSITFAR